MNGPRITGMLVGSVSLVALSFAAWLLLNPIHDTETRVFWTSISMLVLFLIFNLFMPGELVVALIAVTVTAAWSVYVRFGSMWQIGAVLVFGCSVGGGAAVLWLISFVKNAPAHYRANSRPQ